MSQAVSTPPVAKQIPHDVVRHGETVSDPYFWLREKTNPEVIAYLEAENSYTAAQTAALAPFVDTLYKEILGRIQQTDIQVPVKIDQYYYYSRTVEGQQYPLRCRKKGSLTAKEELLLDLNLVAKDHAFVGLGSFAVSNDHRFLAYTLDTTGFRQYTLHVKELASGKQLPLTADRVTSVVWAADNQTLFFTTEDPVTKRSNRVLRQALGDATATPIYDEADELYRVGLDRTKDRKYLIMSITSTDTWEMRLLDAARPRGSFGPVLPREKGHKYEVEHRSGLLYLRTNKGAKNFRLVTAPLATPTPDHWQPFVDHDPAVLIEGVELFKDYAVSIEKTQALARLRVYDFAKKAWHTIGFPEPVYAAVATGTPDFQSKLLRYSYQSPITPNSVYDFDMEHRTAKLLKREEVLGGYDPTLYVTERLWATARDGVKVPISIVYRRGVPRDGSAPLWLFAYGSYGFGVPVGFSPPRVSLLDRGVIYAIAHIRGGDEMGESWHDDGMLLKKKNTFFDFIDVAEFLIAQHWTSQQRLAIQGGSAGGLLMGAVMNLRPDLFRAVHAAVPFVDVMNTMFDASLPLTVGEYLEWGNPNEKPYYDYMKSYSPYDNLERKAYPALLVTTSLNDSQVMYWEPAKFVAKLRAHKTDNNPLLLRCKMEAGHGGASGRYDRLKDQAFEYAWMLAQLGIDR